MIHSLAGPIKKPGKRGRLALLFSGPRGLKAPAICRFAAPAGIGWIEGSMARLRNSNAWGECMRSVLEHLRVTGRRKRTRVCATRAITLSALAWTVAFVGSAVAGARIEGQADNLQLQATNASLR